MSLDAGTQNVLLKRPQLSSHIVVKNLGDDNRVALMDKLTKAVIGTVGQEELEVLTFFTGSNNIAAIAESIPGLETEELIAFIDQLAAQKIVTILL